MLLGGPVSTYPLDTTLYAETSRVGTEYRVSVALSGTATFIVLPRAELFAGVSLNGHSTLSQLGLILKPASARLGGSASLTIQAHLLWYVPPKTVNAGVTWSALEPEGTDETWADVPGTHSEVWT